MGFILIALINNNTLSGLYGLSILLISHGLVSCLLFLLVGLLYVRTNTRYIYYYKGLANIMPLYSIFLLISLLLNSSLPPSLSYFAELHILLNSFNTDLIGLLHVFICLLFNGFYSILLYCRISFNIINNNLKHSDITLTEFNILLLLVLLSFSFSFIF
jgi:NADH:ubiquinone oxidoreductase subunit 4 (subunit M)